MRVLLIKTSSLGDVIHALPAISDAMHAIIGIRFDWVVEETFQEIPSWHPAVERVIPVALRRWRNNPLQAIRSGEWRDFKNALCNQSYDLVLDSQGLLKSAWLASKAKGLLAGYDKHSAREPLATWFYQQTYAVAQDQHAITRQRELFAQALSYNKPDSAPDSGLNLSWVPDIVHPYIVLLHGTTWPSKEWPEQNWIDLAKLVKNYGYEVKVAWGNNLEKERAERIAEASGAMVLDSLPLGKMAEELAKASYTIGVDSGLAHMAAAIGIPSISLYGPTNANRTGALGPRQINLQGNAQCVPCFNKKCMVEMNNGNQPCWITLDANRVWKELNWGSRKL